MRSQCWLDRRVTETMSRKALGLKSQRRQWPRSGQRLGYWDMCNLTLQRNTVRWATIHAIALFQNPNDESNVPAVPATAFIIIVAATHVLCLDDKPKPFGEKAAMSTWTSCCTHQQISHVDTKVIGRQVSRPWIYRVVWIGFNPNSCHPTWHADTVTLPKDQSYIASALEILVLFHCTRHLDSFPLVQPNTQSMIKTHCWEEKCIGIDKNNSGERIFTTIETQL